MISGGVGQFAGLLPPAAASEIFGDPAAFLAGTFRPNGVARRSRADTRSVASGRWPAAVRTRRGSSVAAACLTVTSRGPPTGRPELRLVFLPVGDAAFLNTWDAAGLRGTASHDFVLRDCFIPAHRTCWFTHAPVRPEPLYRLPAIAVFAACIACVPLGIGCYAHWLRRASSPKTSTDGRFV